MMEPGGLTCYRAAIGESDLLVCTDRDLRADALEALRACRLELERYLEAHPRFGTSFRPCPATSGAPEIVRDMAEAAARFEVGPMASVAGAVAQAVGIELLRHSRRVIVENGGDLFLAGGVRRTVRVFAGRAPSIDVAVTDEPGGVGLCTSSASVGPSASLGVADAVTVLAETATLADAAATAIGNAVRSPGDLGKALEKAAGYQEVMGVVVVASGEIGLWGGLELV